MNVLFDLDGTLCDPGAGITGSLQHTLATLGRPVPSADALRRFVGPPLPEVLGHLLDTSDPARVAEGLRVYRARYEAVGITQAATYPGVAEMLSAVQARGDRLWVVTSKPRVYAERVLVHVGLAGRFEAVEGPELAETRFDKAVLIGRRLAAARLEPAACVMVGDRIHDIEGARAHGLQVIGVAWGYGSEDELRRADRIARAPAELPALLAGLSGRTPR